MGLYISEPWRLKPIYKKKIQERVLTYREIHLLELIHLINVVGISEWVGLSTPP